MFHVGCAVTVLQKLMMAAGSGVKMRERSMCSTRKLVRIEIEVIIDSRSELVLVSSAGTCILDKRSFELGVGGMVVGLLGVHGSSRRVVLRQKH